MSNFKPVTTFSIWQNLKNHYSQINKPVRKIRKVTKKQLIWYPGHINKGIDRLNQKLGDADAIIEVHDTRLPFTGRSELMNTFGQVKPRILILNKMDLIRSVDIDRIKRRLFDSGDCQDINTTVIFTQLSDHSKHFKLLEHINDIISERLSTSSKVKAESHILVTGVPNVGKSTFINNLRKWNSEKFGYIKARSNKPTLVGPHAGVTRSVSEKILISDGPPRIYVLDSPGIWEPSKENLESVLKMALCGCFNFDSINKEIVVDYMLYLLNKRQLLTYVDFYGMKEPTDDVIEFTLRVCACKSFVTKANKMIFGQEYSPNVTFAYDQVLKDFNLGLLGKFVIDDIDGCDEASFKGNMHSAALGTIFAYQPLSNRHFPFKWDN